MTLQILVILLFLSLFLGLVLHFRFKEKELDQRHRSQVLILENAILKNRQQIGLRANGLDLYDFSKYNLDESLIAQHEISIP